MAKSRAVNTVDYEIGMMRTLLAQDFMRQMEKLINDNQKKDIYWILVHSDMDATTGKIWTKFLIMDREPPKMLGTMVYYVDNKIGQLRKLWVLPRDIPRDAQFEDQDSAMSVEEFSKRLDSDQQWIRTEAPVVYNV